MTADPENPATNRRRRVPAGPGRADAAGAEPSRDGRGHVGPADWLRTATVNGLVVSRVVSTGNGGALAWGDGRSTAIFSAFDDEGAWQEGPHLPGPAHGAPGIRLQDGTLLIVGGSDGRQVWSWRPGAGAFDVWSPLRIARHGPALVPFVVDEARVGALVVGGLAAGGVPAMLIEGITAKMNFVRGELVRPRPEPLAANLDGTVVILGADDDDESPEVWRVNDVRGTLGRAAPDPRSGAAVIRLGGRVLRVGGQVGDALAAEAHLYDPGADTWHDAGAVMTPRRWPRLVPWGDSGVVLLGGAADRPKVVARVECFDGRDWFHPSTLSVGRADHDAAVLDDGRVLVVGGRTLGDLVPAFSELSSRP